MKAIDFPPAGIFPGTNFMTPEVLGYYRTTHAGRSAYVEISEGRGMDHTPIFGVTVRQANGARFDPDPSCLTFSKAEALAKAREL